MTAPENESIIYVPSARLDHGSYLEKRSEGDIAAAYSADHLSESKPIRRPFAWGGHLWVTVSTGPDKRAQAYKLVAARLFDGDTFNEGSKSSEHRRAQPLGFYHGLKTKHGGEHIVLCGPPVEFIAATEETPETFEQVEQLSLF